jgi:hypothetical protein
MQRGRVDPGLDGKPLSRQRRPGREGKHEPLRACPQGPVAVAIGPGPSPQRCPAGHRESDPRIRADSTPHLAGRQATNGPQCQRKHDGRPEVPVSRMNAGRHDLTDGTTPPASIPADNHLYFPRRTVARHGTEKVEPPEPVSHHAESVAGRSGRHTTPRTARRSNRGNARERSIPRCKRDGSLYSAVVSVDQPSPGHGGGVLFSRPSPPHQPAPHRCPAPVRSPTTSSRPATRLHPPRGRSQAITSRALHENRAQTLTQRWREHPEKI